MYNIETATGNLEAAQTAWQQAREAYLAYRQQDGYAQYYGGKLVDHLLSLIEQQQGNEMATLLEQLLNHSDTPASLQLLIQAVVAIFQGSRDRAMADDMALGYSNAAEIIFLIERLS